MNHLKWHLTRMFLLGVEPLIKKVYRLLLEQRTTTESSLSRAARNRRPTEWYRGDAWVRSLSFIFGMKQRGIDVKTTT